MLIMHFASVLAAFTGSLVGKLIFAGI